MNRFLRNIAMPLVAGLLLATPLRAQQQQAPVALPDAFLYVAAPDVASAWKDIQAGPLYAALKSGWERMTTQVSDPDVANFLAKKAEMEQELGFSVDPDTFFGSVIKSATVSLAPQPGATDPAGLIAFDLADTAKFDALINYLKTKAQANASATQPSKIAEETVGDATLTVFNPGTEQAAYAARRDTLWVMSNVRDVVAKVLSGEAQLAGAPLAAQQAFQKVTQVQPDVRLFVDLTKVRDVAAQQPGMAGGVVLDGARTLAGNMDFQAQEIAAEYVMEIDAQSQSLLARMSRMQPGALEGLGYVPQTTWATSSQNNIALPEIYSYLKSQAAVNPEATAQMNQAVAQVEAALGMSLEQELLPAFGNNAVFALNNVMINPSFPMASTIDLLLGMEVREKEPVLKAMKALEDKIQSQLMTSMGFGATEPGQPAQTPPPGMPQLVQVEQFQGAEIRTFALSNILPLVGANLSPSYTVDGNFFLLAVSKDGLKRALSVKAGSEPSVETLPNVQQVKQRFGIQNQNKISYVNFPAMAPLATTLKGQMQMQMDPSDPSQQILMDTVSQIANSLQDAVGISRFDGTDVQGVSVVTLKRPVQ